MQYFSTNGLLFIVFKSEGPIEDEVLLKSTVYKKDMISIEQDQVIYKRSPYNKTALQGHLPPVLAGPAAPQTPPHPSKAQLDAGYLRSILPLCIGFF